MAYDAPNGFRAEVKEPNGKLKGIYGWTDQDGNLVTKTFLSDENGFRFASAKAAIESQYHKCLFCLSVGLWTIFFNETLHKGQF